MRCISIFFAVVTLFLVAALLVSSAVTNTDAFVFSSLGKNTKKNTVSNHAGVPLKNLPKHLRDGLSGPYYLAYTLQEAFNKKDIESVNSLFADNASIFISSWGPNRVDKSDFIQAITGYFQSVDIIQEDLFVRIGSDNFVLGERVGADIQNNINQFTNTSSNPFYDIFPGFFKLTSCNKGTQISEFETHSVLTQQGNHTMTVKIIEDVMIAFQNQDAGKVMSYIASDAVFNLHPSNGLGPCSGSCIQAMLESYFAGISNKRLRITVDGLSVNFNRVFLKRTDASVIVSGSNSPPQASIMFEMDLIELDASYKIKKWDWYYADPYESAVQPVPSELPLPNKGLADFVNAQARLDINALSNLIDDKAEIYLFRGGYAPMTKSEALDLWKSQIIQANELIYMPIVTVVNTNPGVLCGQMSVYGISNIQMNETEGWYDHYVDVFCLYVNNETGKIMQYGSFTSPAYPTPMANASKMESTVNSLYQSLQELNVDKMLALFSDDFIFRQVPNLNNLPENCGKTCFASFMPKIFAQTYHGLIKPYPLKMDAAFVRVAAIRKNFFVFDKPDTTPVTPMTLIGDGADLFHLDADFKIKIWENIEGDDF